MLRTFTFLSCLLTLLTAVAGVGKCDGIVGGEVSNSGATTPADAAHALQLAKARNMNTVLIPAQWCLIEPQEGCFDFALTDSILRKAQTLNLHIVWLWFGAYKNSQSCYAPAWVKTDSSRFPRARRSNGTPMEILSPYSDAVLQADSLALTAFLRHLALADPSGRTLMLQVENEMGMIPQARDYSPQAQQAYDAWAGPIGDLYADEQFTAHALAQYTQRMAQGAHRVMPDLPLFVNIALNSRNRLPGEYPAGGPLAHLKDIWKSQAPDIFCLAPDIYDPGFRDWIDQYSLPSNPLFIPEIQRTPGNAAQAFYVMGEKDALGLCPFAYDLQPASPETLDDQGRALLLSLLPLIAQHRGSGSMNGAFFDDDLKSRTINRDSLSITLAHYFTVPWEPRAHDASSWPSVGALLIKLAPMKYLLAGTGVTARFSAPDSQIGLLNVTEVQPFIDSEGNTAFRTLRHLSGDETHQGRQAQIDADHYTTLIIDLYRYE